MEGEKRAIPPPPRAALRQGRLIAAPGRQRGWPGSVSLPATFPPCPGLLSARPASKEPVAGEHH